MRVTITKVADSYHVVVHAADGIERHVILASSEIEARTVVFGFQRGVEFARTVLGQPVHFDGKIRNTAGEVI